MRAFVVAHCVHPDAPVSDIVGRTIIFYPRTGFIVNVDMNAIIDAMWVFLPIPVHAGIYKELVSHGRRGDHFKITFLAYRLRYVRRSSILKEMVPCLRPIPRKRSSTSTTPS